MIAAASTEAKLARAAGLGADVGILSGRPDFAQEIRRLTERRGPDVVFEHVGGSTWETLIPLVASGGRLVTCGATTSPLTQLDIRNLWRKQISLHGSTMANDREFRSVMVLLAAGKFQNLLDMLEADGARDDVAEA